MFILHPVYKSNTLYLTYPLTQSTKPQRSRTVTPIKTYGPNTTTPGPPIDYFATMGCDITSFPGLSSASVKVQYSRSQKRLDCKYTISMSPEEFYLKTNENHFSVDIK